MSEPRCTLDDYHRSFEAVARECAALVGDGPDNYLVARMREASVAIMLADTDDALAALDFADNHIQAIRDKVVALRKGEMP